MTEERKLVGLLFADVVDSTALGAQHDPELVRGVMVRYFARMKEIAETHGGTVEKFIGDAVMVVFGVPRLHEDDAERAVRTALAMRDAVAELNCGQTITLALRIGVNSGEVVAGVGDDRQFLVTGDAVNMAARLQQAAAPGEVLVGPLTERLTRHVIEFEPHEPVVAKGRATTIGAFRALRARIAIPESRRDAPALVGRERELRQFLDVFARARDERCGHLMTILGNAGVGKSRLVAEALGRLAQRGDVRVLQGRCLPYGDGITYWPLMEVLRGDAGIESSDDRAAALTRLEARLAELVPDDRRQAIRARIAVVLSLESPAAALPAVPPARVTAELSWGIRQHLEAIASRAPLVVVIDDLQWADPTALEVLAQIADRSSAVPLLLVCIARPELLDRCASWSAGRADASLLVLEPLGTADTRTLLSRLLGIEALPPLVDSWVVERSAGNPLFCEELVRMLVEAKVFELADGQWRARSSAPELPLPETIQSIVAARIDGLRPGEKKALQQASVIGERFMLDELLALGGDVGAAPEALLHKGFFLADGDDPSGRSIRFKHILVRDAAYAGLTRAERAELHERFADIQVLAAADRLAEYEEVIGYHLEQATRHRQQLGLNDERTRALAGRAAQMLGAAGIRAIRRGDAMTSKRLLERCQAVYRRPSDDASAAHGDANA